LGSAAFAGGAVWLAVFSPATQVRDITVAGTEKINKDDCAKLIADEVNKKVAFLDSKSILLFNLDQAKKELLARFPQIQDIKIERQFPSKIYAQVLERREVAVFKASGDKRYLVDGDGIAFEAAPEGRVDLLEIAPGREQEVALGAEAISKNTLAAILRAKADIQALKNISVVGAVIATPERINLQTSEGWFVYLDPLKDIDEQLAKLGAVMDDDSFKSKRANLEYVDVRFTRVYLKEKSQ